MDSAALHTTLLLMTTTTALAATLASSRRLFGLKTSVWSESRLTSPVGVIQVCWPFAAIACLEALELRATGTLVAEWLLPGLVTLVAELFGHSSWFVRWVRWAMIITAVLLTLHGSVLLTRGYTTRPRPLSPGSRVERHWYTPFTGIMRIDRPEPRR